MKPTSPNFHRLAVLGAAAILLGQSLAVANVLNGGFDQTSTSPSQANHWSSTAVPPGGGPGNVRAGNAGGFGWSSGYFTGGYPTNNTFASTVNGPIRQDLTGSGSTFAEGVTYTLTVDLFGSDTWGASLSSSIMWSLGLTANGVPVAQDHWFSDEFVNSTIAAGNGGTIPNNHIINITPGSPGLTTATLTYTATAADAGKTIGVQLGGDAQSRYTFAPEAPVPDDYYGMMDNVALVNDGAATLLTFTPSTTTVDGNPITLSWQVNGVANANTLTLDSGNGAVDALALTNSATGIGSTTVNPTADTTYTLTLNGRDSRIRDIFAGEVRAFSTNAVVATLPSHEVTLSWEVSPPDASVTILDGTNTIDATADTDPETGLGSRVVTVPNPSTIFALSAGGGSNVRSVRVFRETVNSEAFSLNQATIAPDGSLTVTWSGAVAGPTDWIGIYRIGDTPGPVGSTQWNYLNGTRNPGPGPASGSMTFTGLGVGNYFAVLLLNDGYTLAEGPIRFSVAVPPPPAAPLMRIVSVERSGDNLSIVWESKVGYEYDIFASDTLEGDPFDDWSQVEFALPSEGDGTTRYTEDLSKLPGGAPPRRFYRIFEFESLL